MAYFKNIPPSGLVELYLDSEGIIRWKSNHLAVIGEMLKLAAQWPEAVRDETPNLAGQRRRKEKQKQEQENQQ